MITLNFGRFWLKISGSGFTFERNLLLLAGMALFGGNHFFYVEMFQNYIPKFEDCK